jgi:hypothetical protein
LSHFLSATTSANTEGETQRCPAPGSKGLYSRRCRAGFLAFPSLSQQLFFLFGGSGLAFLDGLLYLALELTGLGLGLNLELVCPLPQLNAFFADHRPRLFSGLWGKEECGGCPDQGTYQKSRNKVTGTCFLWHLV